MKKEFQKIFSDQTNVEYWDSIYDQQDFNGDCYRQRMNTVLDWLDRINLPDKSYILDAGCGAGRISQEIANRGYKVFGTDYSLGMAIKANRICNYDDKLVASFLQGDIESLPFKNSCFDVIVCLGVVAYLKSKDEALHELSRVLKPGGHLAISIVNKARIVPRLDFPLIIMNIYISIRDYLVARWGKSSRSSDEVSITTYFIPEFRKALEKSGFNVLEFRTTPWKILTLFGKAVFPFKFAKNITLFFERFTSIPIIDSFGGMCVFNAEKKVII